MPEATSYLPCVLSRLSGLSDGLTVSARFDRLQQEILHNISLLLNSRCGLSVQELSAFPQVQHSTMALGLHDFCGQSLSASRLQALLQEIRQQLQFFEPRLDPDSLQVKAVQEDPLHNSTGIEIYARLLPGLLSADFSCRLLFDFEAGTGAVDSALLQETRSGA